MMQPESEIKDTILANASELVAQVSSMLSRLTSRHDLEARQYAAACLARCNRLLSGMVILYDADHADVAGLGLRPALESWYVGMYLLLAPTEALELVRGAFLHQLERLGDPWGELPLLDLFKQTTESQRVRWDQLSQKVGDLIVENGNPEGRQMCDRMYEVVYRGESALSVHGGLGVFMGHIRPSEPALQIEEVSIEGQHAPPRIAATSHMVATLAREVSATFGINHATLDVLTAKIEAARLLAAGGES